MTSEYGEAQSIYAHDTTFDLTVIKTHVLLQEH